MFCHTYYPNICNGHLPVHLMQKIVSCHCSHFQQKEAQKGEKQEDYEDKRDIYFKETQT